MQFRVELNPPSLARGSVGSSHPKIWGSCPYTQLFTSLSWPQVRRETLPVPGTSGRSGCVSAAKESWQLWKGCAGLHLSKYWFLQQRHQRCQKLLQDSDPLKDHKLCKCRWVLLWKLEGACPHSRSSWHMEFVWASWKGSLSPAGSVQSGWQGCLSSESHLYSTLQLKALHANVLERFWQAASYWYPLCLSLSYSTLCNWEVWHIYPIPQAVSMLFHCTLETKFLFLPTNHFQMNGGVCGSLDFFNFF